MSARRSSDTPAASSTAREAKVFRGDLFLWKDGCDPPVLLHVAAYPSAHSSPPDPDLAFAYIYAGPRKVCSHLTPKDLEGAEVLGAPADVIVRTLVPRYGITFIANTLVFSTFVPRRACFFRGHHKELPFVDEFGQRFAGWRPPCLHRTLGRADVLCREASAANARGGARSRASDYLDPVLFGSYALDAAYEQHALPHFARPARHAPGTLFSFSLGGGPSLLGLVASNEANYWGSEQDYVLYFYRPSIRPTQACAVPPPDHLLIPPVIASDEGWRTKKFKTLRIEQLRPASLLYSHLFMSATEPELSLDAKGHPAPITNTLPANIGRWEHTSVDSLTRTVQDALARDGVQLQL